MSTPKDSNSACELRVAVAMIPVFRPRCNVTQNCSTRKFSPCIVDRVPLIPFRYLSAGPKTCSLRDPNNKSASGWGSYGYEERDAAWIASQGADYLKVMTFPVLVVQNCVFIYVFFYMANERSFTSDGLCDCSPPSYISNQSPCSTTPCVEATTMRHPSM